MQLEDYFNFLSPDDIRIKGTRIGIETVLYDFIHRCRTPEEIAQSYRTLDLEQVYATILYYLHNKEAVSTYLANWIEHGRRMREEQKYNPPPVSEKLRKLRAEREAMRKGIEPFAIEDIAIAQHLPKGSSMTVHPLFEQVKVC